MASPVGIVVRGAFVVLVGPDGVGKTSVAAALGRVAETRYFHFRPPLTRRWNAPEPGERIQKTDTVAGTVDSVVRLTVAFVRFWAGYLVRILPAVVRGTVVVGDRWAYGYLVRPIELRYRGPEWLARAMIRMLPRPDLVVCLVAPPEEIRRRKDELTIAEIERDLRAWRAVPGPVLEIDATLSPDRIGARIIEAVGLPAMPAGPD